MVDLFNEAERLKTFKKWPFSAPNKCTKEAMSEAGFHFTGSKKEPDVASCWFCLKQLDGWEEDDLPREEHKKHASYCKFIQLNKSSSQMSYEEAHDLELFRQMSNVEKYIKTQMNKFKKDAAATRGHIDKQIKT